MLHVSQVGAVPPTANLAANGAPEAQKGNPFHVSAPMNGDLWIMYVKEGDIVHEGQELFNISIMKQEKAVVAKIAGLIKKIHKSADFHNTKQMVPVKAGELIIELVPVPPTCQSCGKFLPTDHKIAFCPYCGEDVFDKKAKGQKGKQAPNLLLPN
jgi:pyruvate carboxylase